MPEKPIKADREIQSSVICRILDDETEAKKFIKSGKKTTLAGTFARIRVNIKDKQVYSIVDSGGSNASTARVKFFSRFDTKSKRLQYARSTTQQHRPLTRIAFSTHLSSPVGNAEQPAQIFDNCPGAMP